MRIGNGKQLFADNTAIAMILFSYWLAFTLPAQKYTEAVRYIYSCAQWRRRAYPSDSLAL